MAQLSRTRPSLYEIGIATQNRVSGWTICLLLLLLTVTISQFLLKHTVQYRVSLFEVKVISATSSIISLSSSPSIIFASMAPTVGSKRKASASPVASPHATKVGKQTHTNTAPEVAKSRPRVYANARPVFNTLKTDLSDRPSLQTFVFGTGSMGELGLGPDSKSKTVKRPRLNPLLEHLNVVDVAVGGMHAAALTKDGELYTWGVNDHGALGRDTAWDGGVVDADAAEDSDSEAESLNPKESTPTKIDGPQRFVKVAASDNITVAIDQEGHIWAWGTFRCSDGILGFSTQSVVANRPQKLALKEKFTDLACGTDHILALSTNGRVFAWGNGQQFQLGRRVVERTRLNGLIPREFGLKKIVLIGSGAYHSFAKDSSGKVYAWGLNQFGQCGITMQELGEDGAVVAVPAVVAGLEGKDIVHITGGEHHSMAITSEGELYVWGRMDASELGFPRSALPDNVVSDISGKPRFVPSPTLLRFDNDTKARTVACGSHHNILIDEKGLAWSWGFGECYQVGQGPPGEDIEIPTRIDNSATQDKNMVLAGAGGQFSLLCALRHEETPHINGTASINGHK